MESTELTHTVRELTASPPRVYVQLAGGDTSEPQVRNLLPLLVLVLPVLLCKERLESCKQLERRQRQRRCFKPEAVAESWTGQQLVTVKRCLQKVQAEKKAYAQIVWSMNSVRGVLSKCSVPFLGSDFACKQLNLP